MPAIIWSVRCTFNIRVHMQQLWCVAAESTLVTQAWPGQTSSETWPCSSCRPVRRICFCLEFQQHVALKALALLPHLLIKHKDTLNATWFFNEITAYPFRLFQLSYTVLDKSPVITGQLVQWQCIFQVILLLWQSENDAVACLCIFYLLPSPFLHFKVILKDSYFIFCPGIL